MKERRQLKKQEKIQIVCHTPENAASALACLSPRSTMKRKTGFKSKPALRKAVKKLLRDVPTSPSKRKGAVAELARECGLTLKEAQSTEPTTSRRSLSVETASLVTDFYFQTNVVYTTPGIKDEMAVWKDGIKTIFTMALETDSPTSSTAPTTILRSRTVKSRLRSDSLRTEPYPNLREKSAAAKSKGKKKKTSVPDRVAGGGELSRSSSSTTGPTFTDSATNCAPRQSSKTSTAISCPRCKEMGHVSTTCSFTTHLPDALTCPQCVRTYTNGGSALDVHIVLCSAHGNLCADSPADAPDPATALRQRRMRAIVEKVDDLTSRGMSSDMALNLCKLDSAKYEKIKRALF